GGAGVGCRQRLGPDPRGEARRQGLHRPSAAAQDGMAPTRGGGGETLSGRGGRSAGLTCDIGVDSTTCRAAF
ncbi:MAG: hypothetical protein AAF677_16525, partial [Pseudomonadota bacterium]